MRRHLTRTVAIASGVVALLLVPAIAHADPQWRLEQPPPPAGAPFKVALGAPGDMQFWAPNRGLLTVAGNAVAPGGIYLFNGAGWRSYSSVCGGSPDTTRIAWAGPTEFWVISAPSKPRIGDGITLCHVVDGAVKDSFGTALQSSDPYHEMNAAVCLAPDDCWFGGGAARDPSGGRSGAFRLHWNGTALKTSYGPQGRGISDMENRGGQAVESTLVGPYRETRTSATLRIPETVPLLLHRLGSAGFASDPFVPDSPVGVPVDGTELLALDDDGQRFWAVGGGAASGPSAPVDGAVARSPVVATAGPGEVLLSQVHLNAPPGTFGPTDRFTDVAAIPGTTKAWVVVQPFSERSSVNARARVALIDAADGSVQLVKLPLGGAGRGSAARIACPSPTECWMVTRGGWLFHWTDGTPLEVDTDPAFAGSITVRPNESAAQFVPDTAPPDISLPIDDPIDTPTEDPVVPDPVKLKAVIYHVRQALHHPTTLVLRFKVRRKVTIGLVGKRRSRIVARSKVRTFKKRTNGVLTMKLNRKRWPTKLAFRIKEPDDESSTDGDTTITRGAPPIPKPVHR